MLRSSGMSGAEFMTVLLQVIRELANGYLIASDRSEKFRTVKALEKETNELMKYVQDNGIG
jgi:hypothetical protein